MSVLKSKDASSTPIREGVKRRLINASNLMMVVIDFANGPWHEPEPFHHHMHEQTTYIAKGEIIFFCEGEPDQKLVEGDMFCVAANKKHTIQLLSTEARLVDSFNPIREEFL